MGINDNNYSESNGIYKERSDIGDSKNKLVIMSDKEISIKLLKEAQTEENGIIFNFDTVDSLFEKYPRLTSEEFQLYFLDGVYNKNLLQCSPGIIDLLDLSEVELGDDLIAYILSKVSVSEEEFRSEVEGKIDVLTFPNLNNNDVAQGYFYDKISDLMSGTDIIFGNIPEIRDNFGEKAGLLLYMEGEKDIVQGEIDQFLQISNDELIKRNQEFQKIYDSLVYPLVYGITLKFLKNSFPEKF